MSRTRKEKFYFWIGRKVLDLAERLPETTKFGIADLKINREFDRKAAEDERLRATPPKNAKIDFLGFTMVETFKVEEFARLEKGFLRLFPTLTDPINSFDFREEFSRRTETLYSGSWQNIGYLYRDSKGIIGPTVKRHMPSLPPEVEYIHIELQHMLPSVIAINCNVVLNESATESLIQIQTRSHLPDVRFRYLAPWKFWLGHLSYPSELVRRRLINECIARLRAKVEDQLRPFIRGHFSQRFKRHISRLPSIEVFAIKGSPKTKAALARWQVSARHWLESFSIGYGSESYRSSTLSFEPTWRTENELDDSSEGRFVVYWEKYLKQIEKDPSDAYSRESVFYRLCRNEIGALVTRTGLLGLLWSIQRRIEKIRTETIKRTSSFQFLRSNLNFYDSVLRATMLLARFSLEFAQQTRTIKSRLEPLSDFHLHLGNQVLKEKSFNETSFIEVERTIGFLENNLRYLRESFSQLLELKNLRSSNRLQILILVLSVIATVGTIVSAVASWPILRQIFFPPSD